MLEATSAWRIDEAAKRFVELSTANLRCGVDGIVTVDGGL